MNGSTIKRCIACALVALTVTGTLPVMTVIPSTFIIASAAESELYTSGDYLYDIVAGGVRFRGYKREKVNGAYKNFTPSTGEMIIPNTLDGQKVVEVGSLQNVTDYKTTCTSITIPNNVQKIDADTFKGWTKVATVNVGSSLTTIESKAFSGCSSLTLFNCNSTVLNTVGARAFESTKLGFFTVKNTSLLTIEAQAFASCSYLTKVQTGTGGVVLGSKAFAELPKLESVDLCSSSTTASQIGSQAFYGCSKLSSVVLPEGLTVMDSGAFYQTGVKTVNLGSLTKLKTIPENAFRQTKIQNITIPTSVTMIGNKAFGSIVAKDDRNTTVDIVLTFNKKDADIKIDKAAFDSTVIKNVTIPTKAFTTTEGIFDVSTFASVENLTISSPTQQVTKLGNLTKLKSVSTPYGSYIWACERKAYYKAHQDEQPEYLTIDGSSFETYSTTSNAARATYTYTPVTLSRVTKKDADGVMVSYATSVAKSDVNGTTAAKDVSVRVKTGYSVLQLDTFSDIKTYFGYKDTVATNGESGTFVLSTKKNVPVKLSSSISCNYTIAAESFKNITVSFDTEKDAERGIYNKEYDCYVTNKDTTVVKPTVIVKFKGKDTVIDSKYLNITYSNNKGIRSADSPATVKVSLNDAGKKLFKDVTYTAKKTFVIKMNVKDAVIAATNFIAPDKTIVSTDTPGVLTTDADKSGFKPVKVTSSYTSPTESIYGITASKLIVMNRINGKDGTTANSAAKLTVSAYKFRADTTIGSNLPYGKVTATIKADNSPYYFGSVDVSYYTKMNIGNYDNIVFTSGSNKFEVIKTKDANNAAYYGLSDKFVYTGNAVTFGTIKIGSSLRGFNSNLTSSYYTVKYANNIKAGSDSGSATLSNMASVTLTADTSKTKSLYGSKTISYIIIKKQLTADMFEFDTDYVYTGGAIAPTVTATYNGKKLVKDKDYTIKLQDNIMPGTAKITFTGTGTNFKGSVTKTFTIEKVSLNRAKIEWVKNKVSWMFGLPVEPIPVVTYKEQVLEQGVDYDIVYLGKKVDGSYTGVSARNIYEQSGIVVVPLKTSKYLLSTDEDNLVNIYYGEGTATGVLKEFTVQKLDLDNVTLQYPDSLVSGKFADVQGSLRPDIIVNGQVLKAYTAAEMQGLIVSTYNMRGGDAASKTLAQKMKIAAAEAPSAPNIVAYYGYMSKTGVIVYGKIERTYALKTQTENGVKRDYYDIEDKLKLRKSETGAFVDVVTLKYVTKFNAQVSTETAAEQGILVFNLVQTLHNYKRETPYFVKPGILSVYVCDLNDRDRSILANVNIVEDTFEKSWSLIVKPSSPVITTENYTIRDLSPGSMTVHFKACSSDVLDGKTNYHIKLYDNVEDATKDTNAVMDIPLQYCKTDTTRTTTGLSVSSKNTGVYYEYTIRRLKYGKVYFVCVYATDTNTQAISRLVGKPKLIATPTYRAEINSAVMSYNKNGMAYDMKLNMTLPSHVVDTDNAKTDYGHIFYEVKFKSVSNNEMQTFRVSETGTIDGLPCDGKLVKDSSGNYTVTLYNLPGTGTSPQYTVSVRTLMYFNTANYNAATHNFECLRNKNGRYLGVAQTQTYYAEKLSVVLNMNTQIAMSGEKVTATASLVNVPSGVDLSKVNATCKFVLKTASGKQVWTQSQPVVNGSASYTFTETVSADSNYILSATISSNDIDVDGNAKTARADLTVRKKITNISTVDRCKINPNNSVLVNLGVTGAVHTTDADGNAVTSDALYTIHVLYYGTDSKRNSSNLQKKTTVLTKAAKENGAVYDLGGKAIFNKVGYYTVAVVAYDPADLSSYETKTFNVYVTNDPVNVSRAYAKTGYIEDGISVDCQSNGITASSLTYVITVKNKSTGKVIMTKTVKKSGSVSMDFSADAIAGTYTVSIKVTGTEAQKGLTVSSTLQMTYGALVNMSTLDKDVVTKGGTVKVYALSKGVSGADAEYSATIVNVATGKEMQLDAPIVENGQKVFVINTKNLSGTYIVNVKAVKNGKSAVLPLYLTVTQLNTYINDYSITDTYGTNIVTTTTNNLKLGSIIKITGSPATSLVDFKVYYKKSANTDWIEVTNNATDGTYYYTINPNTATTYNIKVVADGGNDNVISRTYKVQVTK